jgi:NADH-quinone oxidoreductase subunit C
VSKINASDFVKAFQKAHPEAVKIIESTGPKRADLVVEHDDFIDAAESLRDDFGFTIPVSGGAVDYPDDNRIQMIYYLMHPNSRFMLTYRVDLDRDGPRLPSLTQVWEAMSFHEREAHEMFGIDFEGHPNMIPLLLPPDWKGGHPLLKDFKGEGQQ